MNRPNLSGYLHHLTVYKNLYRESKITLSYQAAEVSENYLDHDLKRTAFY